MGNDNPMINIDIFPQESIPENMVEIGSAGSIINQLPALFGASRLSKAYKVVMPEGVSGHLMQLKNGLLSTSVIGENGKIAATAGLQSLSNLASPMAVFSVASMITGQYFMAQINSSLTCLTEGVAEVQRQLDTSEESTVFSASIYIQEIKNDWPLIMSSDEMKKVYASSILETINKLTSSCYYFENRINGKINEIKKSLDKNKPCDEALLSEAKRNTEFLKYAYEIRSCLKIMLIFLTSGINKDNSDDIKSILERDEQLIFSSTISQLDKQIDELILMFQNAPKIKVQEQAKKHINTLKEIRSLTRERYNDSIVNNMMETVDKFALMDSKGQEFYIENGKIFIQK